MPYSIQQYQQWFDEVVRPTAPMMQLIPPDSLEWKLTERSFTLGQLIDHIPKSLWYNTKVLRGEELPLKSMREIFVANRRQPSATVEAAVDSFSRHAGDFRQAVGELGDDRFLNGELDTPQLGRIPYWRFSAFVLEHHIHHLMELHLNLKVLGVGVHTGLLYAGKS
jgi:hypothetical protein